MEIISDNNLREIVAGDGRFLRRIGSDACFTRGMMLPGETEADFEEADRVPGESLEKRRLALVGEIEAYDRSEAVNRFYFHGMPMWLPRDARIMLKDRFEREKAGGIARTNLFYDGRRIDLAPDEGLALIDAVSAYADCCFDNTQRNMALAKELGNERAIDAFDKTQGYPAVLNL